ncbi:MAG: S8 family serine peptidase [Acidobacteriota bacterium]|nr:S8 family serine peptidase [Acidobacteriota bacterium]
MSKYRIKAYFMHEYEEGAAKDAVNNSIITEAEITPGYIMGVVEESAISKLSDQGLVVSVVEEVVEAAEAKNFVTGDLSTVTSDGPPSFFGINAPLAATMEGIMPRPIPVATAEKKDTKDKIFTQDERRSQFYIVRFHGAITEERHNELRKLRIKLMERLSRNKYKVKLKPSEVEKLAALQSVDYLRLYTEKDTLCIRDTEASTAGYESSAGQRSAAAAVAKSVQPKRIRLYNVRVHEKKDLGAIVKWLGQKKRKPLRKSGDQLQVALFENSKMLKDLAARPEVAIVEQVEAPQLYDEHARALLGIVQKTKKLEFEGEGEIIGVADTGIDVAHPDLASHIIGTSAWGRPGNVSDPEGHGTHVTGCVLGDGTASNGLVMGAAPKAKVFFQSILDLNGGLGGLPADLGKLFKEAYDKGARIHNNSWGAFNFARYSGNSLDVDRFVAANPDMLIVIAAGNDGMGIPRVSGSQMSSDKGFVDWPSVASPATAKNGLTVGASRSSRKEGGLSKLTWNDAWPDRYPDEPISKELISSDARCLAAFSSRGPSNDQRIKPDVVAPGTDIAAAKSKDAPLHKFWGAFPNNKKYGFMGGTSMAAPYVAGCAALVREWYRKRAGWATPSAALLKATLINGTRRIIGKDAVAKLEGEPNYHQGFGCIDMSNTVPNVLSPKLKLEFDDKWKDKSREFTQTGQRFRFTITSGSALPLRLCLAWTDPPANGLQNSLLLLVDDESHMKWAGNAQAATLLNIAGGQRDTNNNVQIVRIDKPKGVYTIVVVASNLVMPPQSFSLVVTGDLKTPLTFLP